MRLLFDRGTVLVLDPLPSLDAGALPGVLWDPRVAAHRAPACAHAGLAAELARRGVPFEDHVPAVERPEGAWRAPELRPYQEAALDAWELAGRRGLVVLPTGSGKTRVAMAAMARTGLAALCLVPTRVLLEQWLRELRGACGGAVGVFGDGARSLAPITVATFESAWRHMERIGNRFALAIVDEAHHFGGGVRSEALEMCAAGARLGLTATPPEGQAAARLAPFEMVRLHVDLTAEERERYERWMEAFRPVRALFRRLAPAGSWDDFARWAARTDEGRRAMAAWRAARRLLAFPAAKRTAVGALLSRHHGARILVFTAGNESAYAVAREHLVPPLTCDIGRAERAEVLERFRAGEVRALVSAQVLNEGLDVPDAEVAVVVAGALGKREHVQRVGRLLRPREGKRALVYELVARGTLEVHQSRRRRDALAA